MVGAHLFVEGGGTSKEQHARCREGFRKLLNAMGFDGRLPRISACGGRGEAYDDFLTALSGPNTGAWIGLWVDSEEPMVDPEAAWEHLEARDGWGRPKGAEDIDVLLMVTCMESWLVADRDGLKKHYANLQAGALPSLQDLEGRARGAVQDALVHATRNCSNAYRKGSRSFELLAKVNPDAVGRSCPSLLRCRRILEAKL